MLNSIKRDTSNTMERLAGSLPKPRTPLPAQKPAPSADGLSLGSVDMEDLLKVWKSTSRPQYTAELLKRLKPTIRSAISSYAPGMENSLSVPAAKLALEALKSYDPKYGASPRTHVFNHLKRLNRIGARRSFIIPQSESRMLDRRRMDQAMDQFIDDNDREPSMEELADATGLSRKRLDSLMEDRNSELSESASLTDESMRDTFTHSDMDDHEYFEYVYSSVGPTDQKIMEWSSGAHGKPALSNNEIARRLGVSAAAVSQRKRGIQDKMSEVRSLI